MTVFSLATLSETVNVMSWLPLSPSKSAQSQIEISGRGSLSRIVPRPCGSAIVALLGLVRLTNSVSSNSSRVSPQIGMMTG